MVVAKDGNNWYNTLYLFCMVNKLMSFRKALLESVFGNDREYTVEKVPSYAISYLENGEEGNLDDKDIAIIEKWVKEMTDDGYDMTSFEYLEDDAHFSRYPAFGLPTDCIETKIYKRD